MSRRQHPLNGLLLCALSAILLVGCGGETRKASPPAEVGGHPGNLAPEFALKTIKGDTLRLSDLRGNVVLVDFWATWCAPCKASMPHLQEIHETMQDKGVRVVAVSVDRQGERVVKPFIDKYGFTFDVLLTDNKIEGRFGGIQGIPTTFIIKPDGTVYKRFVGYQPKATYLQAITALKPELSS